MKPKLTEEETRVSALKQLGLTNKVIAERMGCSMGHIGKLWKSVREKTGIETRAKGRPHADGKTQPKKNGGEK